MRLAMVVVTGFILTAHSVSGFEPGEKVVLVRPVEMKATTGSTVSLTPGAMLTVQAVEADRLKVAAGRVGWVDAAAVIPATKADEHFSTLLSADSKDAAALLARGKFRVETGDIDRAMVDLEQSLAIAPNSEVQTLYAYCHKRKGDKEQAMKGFDEAIRLDPKNALAWRFRGATWAGLAQYDKAVANYTESIRIDPDNPDSLHHRAILTSACNDAAVRNGKQAVEDGTRACEVSDWTSSNYLTGLAAAFAEAGDFEAAEKWLSKAIALSPSDQRTAMLEGFRQHKPFRTTWR